MGCSHSDSIASARSKIIRKISNAIQDRRVDILKELFEEFEEIDPSPFPAVDRPIIEVHGISFNALSYSIFLDDAKAFKYIYQTLNASIVTMEKQLMDHKITALDIMCQKGLARVLEVYIPLYLDYEMSITYAKNESFDVNPDIIAYTPIQKACELGNINVISIIMKYFEISAHKYIPVTLDVHHIEESTGENCALIACRTGDFTMIKYLYEVCGADFFVKNNNSENAVIVCLAGYRKKPCKNYYGCIFFLIEKIGIDPTYKYEECLLMACNTDIVAYLETKLAQYGINTTKCEIEHMNKIKPFPIPKTELEINLDSIPDREFTIKKYIKDETLSSNQNDTLLFSGASNILGRIKNSQQLDYK